MSEKRLRGVHGQTVEALKVLSAKGIIDAAYEAMRTLVDKSGADLNRLR